LLAPAVGERLVAFGRVVRAGRTITVCTADVRAFGDGHPSEGKSVALMQATMTTIHAPDAGA
jgi:acyl-coenzyme A thioesterase PaaI-like protein